MKKKKIFIVEILVEMENSLVHLMLITIPILKYLVEKKHGLSLNESKKKLKTI